MSSRSPSVSAGSPNRNTRTRSALAICAVLCTALWCWLEARGATSTRDSYLQAVRQTEQMSADVNRIQALRAVPQVATERLRPNDELLAEVREALERADLPTTLWIGNDPSQPVRVPKSSYKRLSTRLSFEDVTLRQLSAFSFHLLQQDPALSVSEVRLHAPRSELKGTWSAELTIGYLIYSPYGRIRQ